MKLRIISSKRLTWVVLLALLFEFVPPLVQEAMANETSITYPALAHGYDISLGATSACAVESAGTILCWGKNTNGQLGNGLTVDSRTPVRVIGITDAIAVSVGGASACAILADSSVSCWGSGANGQFGDGTTNGSLSPKPIGLSNVKSLSVGTTSSCAVIQDSSVKCWGDNFWGQSGMGSVGGIRTITAVSGLSGVASVSVQGGAVCVVLEDGQVKCWGSNKYLILGTTSLSYSTRPLALTNISGVSKIALGVKNACAVLRSGLVKCWGDNASGQLGDGTNLNSAYPLVIPDIQNALMVSVGGLSACANLADGSVKCWGSNSWGQLGDGTKVASSMPTQVVGLKDSVQVALSPNASGSVCSVSWDAKTNCWGGDPLLFANGIIRTESSLPADTLLETQRVEATSRSLTIAWVSALTENPGTLDGYFVRYRSEDAGSWKSLEIPLSAGRSVHLEDLESNTRYRVEISPIDGPGVTHTMVVYASTLGTDNDRTSLAFGRQVSAGSTFSCAALDDGRVQCWGQNTNGQLGDGTHISAIQPVTVSQISSAQTVSAGRNSACAVLFSGEVQCWGSNTYGILGGPEALDSAIPVVVSGLSSAVTVGVGTDFACALLREGSVYCWGNNDHGQLGTTSVLKSNVPLQVPNIASAVSLSVGDNSACVVLADEKIRCWTNPSVASGASFETSVKKVAVGASFGCALHYDQTVACWGDNSVGQLGRSNILRAVLPVGIESLSPILDISARSWSACVATLDRLVSCWGWNDFGQLGIAGKAVAHAPNLIPNLTGAVSISVSEQAGCSVIADSSIKCWGSNSDVENQGLVDVATSAESTQVKVGLNFACLVSTASSLKCWGANDAGQLGDGTLEAKSAPVAVSTLGAIQSVDVASGSACAVETTGAVKCWGSNLYGQLSNATQTLIKTPTVVSGITTATKVSVGETSGCALLANTYVTCWGTNTYGQLGNGSTNSQTALSRPLFGAVDVSVGANSACAVLSDGQVNCWGRNGSGQLGNDSTTDSSFPVKVSGIWNAVKVRVRGESACALLANATILCWGKNLMYSAGDPVNWERIWRRPHSITLPTTVNHIEMRGNAACVITSQSEVYCWGDNRDKYFGDTQPESLTTPTLIENLKGVTSLSLGNFSCFVTASSSAKCWGNSYYSLGNDTLNSLAPVRILSARPIPNQPAVLINGSDRVGGQLAAGSEGWRSGTKLAFQWHRDGMPIKGQTTQTYVVSPSDYGHEISVSATASLDGFAQASKSSLTLLIRKGILSFTPSPTISGQAIFGSTLTALPGNWDVGISLKYKWLRDGLPINLAINQSYTLGADDVGHVVAVAVTGSLNGYEDAVGTSLGLNVKGKNLSSTPLPTISGTFKFRSVLTATSGQWDPGVSIAYKWLRDGVPIPNAIDDKYTLIAADVGHVISVSVTGSKEGFASLSKKRTGKSVQPLPMIIGKNQISGIYKVGQTLTSTCKNWVKGAQISYQWLLDGKPISRAVSKYLKLQTRFKGHKVSVFITQKLAGYYTAFSVSPSKTVD